MQLCIVAAHMYERLLLALGPLRSSSESPQFQFGQKLNAHLQQQGQVHGQYSTL